MTLEKESSDFIKAKKLFLKYGGSSFHMSREGIIEEYKKYEIPKEIENSWLKEMFENYFALFDITNLETVFPLSYMIEHHLKTEYFNQFIELIRNQIGKIENQYYIYRYAQTLFSLVEIFSRYKTELSRELKIKGIDIAEEINKLARNAKIPEHFQIEYFDINGNGLTQEQYVFRQIVDLENKIQIARILQ